MLLSPTFEMSKFLVTQVNMNDNLKLLQKVTTYKQPLYKKKKKIKPHRNHLLHKMQLFISMLMYSMSTVKGKKPKGVNRSAANVHLSKPFIFNICVD